MCLAQMSLASRKATSFEEAATDVAEALRRQLEKARNRAA